jgi:predicted CopG family antitoxin
MQNIQELKDNYDKNTLKTIVVSKKIYDKLKQLGFTGESFNTVVGRLLEQVKEFSK